MQPKPTANSRHRLFFNFKRNTNRDAAKTIVEEPYDLHTFAREFKSALDRYRVSFCLKWRNKVSISPPTNPMFRWRQSIAVPLYAISPIEAAMHSSGLISNALCDQDKFIDWVLDHRQLVDSRFGLVQSVHIYRGHVNGKERKSHWAIEESIIIGLENDRGIPNWIRVKVLHGSGDRTSCVRLFCFRFCAHADMRDSREIYSGPRNVSSPSK